MLLFALALQKFDNTNHLCLVDHAESLDLATSMKSHIFVTLISPSLYRSLSL